MSTAQNSVENQLVHDVSDGCDGVAIPIVCGVDPKLKTNWLGEPADPRGVCMSAVAYVSDAVEIHCRIERGRTDVDVDSGVRIRNGDVRVDADLLVTAGSPRRLRCFYC